MQRHRSALTLTEMLFILGVTIGLSGVLILVVAHAFDNARRASCRNNLLQIGRALALYTQTHGGYYPFVWHKANGVEPDGTGAENAAMAATSIGGLFPTYIRGPNLFRCPSTLNAPSFLTLEADENTFPLHGAPARTHTVVDSSYGYDPRLAPRLSGGHAIFGDMDGSRATNARTTTQNHDDGQNVLFADGSVVWTESNHCSNESEDNIFAEDAWNADTDSYLLRQDTPLRESFQEYTGLHHPAKAPQ